MTRSIRKILSDIKYDMIRSFEVRKDRKADPEPVTDFDRLDQKYNRWCDNVHVIRHAGGEVDGKPYLNCLEAFKRSADAGCTALEADLQLTKDERVVLLHDQKSALGIDRPEEEHLDDTEQAFMERKIAGRYTPMNIESLIVFMKEHPDVYIVTDCKQQSMSEVLGQIVSAVKDESAEERKYILSHMVIQLYHYEDCELVQNIYHFPNMIFTLYDSGLYIWNAERIVKHCLRDKIGVVTMPYGFIRNKHVLDLFNRYNIRVFVHTINGRDDTRCYQDAGVWGIYSDDMTKWDVWEKDIEDGV